MWMVWSNENGMIVTTDCKEEALKAYADEMQWYKDNLDGGFNTDEHVILSKIEKQLYSFDTKNPVLEEDDDGNEIETSDTYWDWKEDVFSE